MTPDSGATILPVAAQLMPVTVLGNGIMDGRPEYAGPIVMLGLGLGLTVGLFNGLDVTLARIHPLILTFGMLSVLQGAIFMYRTIWHRAGELQAAR